MDGRDFRYWGSQVDYEQFRQYLVTVRATVGDAFEEAVMTINVTDVAEAAAFVEDFSYGWEDGHLAASFWITPG